MTATLTLDPSLKACPCRIPNPYEEPAGKRGTCKQCGYRLDPRWTCTTNTTREFLQRLSEANPGAGESFKRFEAQIIARQQAGEAVFGQRFHGRDNIKEAQEECSDLAMYAALQVLVQRRDDSDEEMDIALEIAQHAAKAYELLEIWRAKNHGRP